MGLDGVELILTIEEEFGIDIPDAEASRTITVGDLFVLVCRLCDMGSGKLSAGSRESLCAIFQSLGLASDLGDDQRLLAIVPISRRRELWARLQREYGRKPPPFQSPVRAWHIGVAEIVIAGVLIGVVGLIPGIIVAPMAGLVAVAVLNAVLVRYRPAFSQRCQTFSELVAWSAPISTTADVWTRLLDIIAEQMAVKKEDINPQTRLVEDLKIG